ncbi:MAG TPA: chromate transporter [Paralcaligenes sp.]|jgi:chromate transporter
MSALQMNSRKAPIHARPQSIAELYTCFTWLAVQGFGGAAPVAQRELVERKHWLTQQEFLEDWAVAQIMPGPNVVNLSIMLGDRYFGLRGAMAALAGMISIPLLLVLAMTILYTEYSHYDVIVRALRSMGAVAAGLIIGTGFKLFSTLKSNPIGLPAASVLIVFTFVVVALLRWPLLVVLLITGIPATIWAAMQLARHERKERT